MQQGYSATRRATNPFVPTRTVKGKWEAGPIEPASHLYEIYDWSQLGSKVNAHVKSAVIPIRFMIPAPLPVSIHPGNIVADLATVLPMLAGVPVYPSAIRFELARAI